MSLWMQTSPVKWCKELQCAKYPHFLEKNKDDANLDSSKQKWNDLSTKKLLTKKYEEYESTSILGRIYDLVKKENFDMLLEVQVDEQFEFEGWKDYSQCWSEHFINYKNRMQIEMKKSEEQEFKDCASENIFAHYKKIFVGEGKSEEQRFKEASAIYAVVYADSKSKELNRQTLKFAWKVAGSELCSIYSRRTSEGSMSLARENLGFFLRQ